MGVLESFGMGFDLTRKNIKLWVLLVLISIVLIVISMPVMLLAVGPAMFQSMTAGTQPPVQAPNINWPLFVIIMLIASIVQIFINAGIVGCARDIIKTGSVKLSDFLEYAKKYFGRFIIFTFIIFLGTVIAILILTLMGIATGLLWKGLLPIAVIIGVLLAAILVIVLVLVALFSALVPIAIVAEDKRIGESFKSAAGFLGKKLWQLIGLGSLFFLLYLILGVINYVFSLLGIPAATFVMQIIINLAQVYLAIASIIAFMHFYLSNNIGRT